MRLRWKYFLVLLLVSALPLLVATGVSQWRTRGLAEEVSAEVRDRLHSMIRSQLTQDAREASEAVLQGKASLELALDLLALRAEGVLGRNFESLPRVYRPKDFADPTARPQDAAPREGYVLAEGNATIPLWVSLDEPVFLYTPEASFGAPDHPLKQDTARLAALVPVCARLYEGLSPMAYRVSLILDSGVTAVYPGSDGYPESFDPRQASWYKKARAGEQATTWSDLLVSRSTGKLFFAATRPLVRDGRVVGVAAVEVPLSWFLQERHLSDIWSEEMRTFLVRAEDDPETGKPGLRVLAKKEYRQKAGMLPGSDYEWVAPVDDPHWPVLVASIFAGKSGTLEMDMDGLPSIWAFAPQARDVSFLLVVPEVVAMNLAGEIRESVNQSAERQRYWLMAVTGGVLLLALVVAMVSAGRGTRVIRAIAVAWERLAHGDFDVRIQVKTGDERDRLVEAFNQTVPQLAEHVRMRHSLELARQVQQDLLPGTMPRIHGLDLGGLSIPCDETGGDSLDLFPLGVSGRLALVVGDVSGHGAAAALLMATVRAMIRMAAARPGSPQERVSLVNGLLAEDVSDSGRFVTLFYLEVDGGRGQLVWVRAGHAPALLYDPESGAFTELGGPGPALGFLEHVEYEADEMAFKQPGLVLAVGTDGIWEAENPEGEQFGKERYQASLARHADLPAQKMVEEILADVDDFRRSAPLRDDITLAIVKKV